jgi:transposase
MSQPPVPITPNGQDELPGPPPQARVPRVDTEVLPRPHRRRFTADYKRRILAEADQCRQPGQLGALLRREGLYSSHLTTWRRQRAGGRLESPRQGRVGADPAVQELSRLQRENQRLQKRLSQAETIIAVQKKLCDLLGLPSADSPKGDSR